MKKNDRDLTHENTVQTFWDSRTEPDTVLVAQP